jgi:hypothetical protein
VTRIVLLAGLNRGWTVESPVSRFETLWNNLGTAIGHVLPRKPTLFAIRRGAPFLTLTRLEWLALSRTPQPPPVTVQLLGTRDDIVSPTDNVDLATGSDFVYLEVPQSGHFDVIDMGQDTPVQRARRTRFQAALTASRDELARIEVSPDDVAQLLDGPGARSRADAQSPSQQPTDLVIVVHGIRDKGFWTRKIARVVVARGRELQRQVAATTPSYGYLAMLPFLCPWTRRAKVEWLLDLYVTIRALYPEAAISFVGHSNGTYILAAALESCRAVRFKNVVFAGSVVRSQFDWSSLVQSGQVGRVLNYVATADWVVAIFPRLFQMLGLQDLGGAGHDGFANEPGIVTDIEYLPGRHSTALDEQHWSDIASFVLDGPVADGVAVARRRNPFIVAAAHSAPVIWLLGLVAALLPGYLVLTALGFPELTGLCHFERWRAASMQLVPAWLSALSLMAYVAVLRAVLTRL